MFYILWNISMEKVIWWKKILFKEKLNMGDRQKVMRAKKKFDETNDEFEFCFDLFPILCINIDWQEMSDQQKIEFVKKVEDMSEFAEISWAIAEIQTKIAEELEKKKISTDMNSKSETKPGK